MNGKLEGYLNFKTIVLKKEALNKEDIIKELLDTLCGINREVCDNREEIYSAIWNREREKSTGVGKAVAIPHGRSNKLEHIYVALAKIEKGLEWASVDSKPVRFVFLVIGPKKEKVEEYLNILAQISKLVSRQDTRECLIQATSKEQILSAIRDIKDRQCHKL